MSTQAMDDKTQKTPGAGKRLRDGMAAEPPIPFLFSRRSLNHDAQKEAHMEWVASVFTEISRRKCAKQW